jgi:hypothetical protein
LADGRIAINTNTASPGLFFKDSAGTGIVKVGPVHVGTTAPNSVPASGGSSGNYTGEQWLDTSVSPAQMKVWNGSTWVGIVADELPVSKLQDGAARQLIQTDAAGTGVEWTSNVDVPGTLDVTSTATFDSIAQHPLGTAGAPTITFTGDTNTGIYSPGADQVAISTNGVQRMNIEADGDINIDSGGVFYDATNNRLAIGTTSPGEKLEVANSAAGINDNSTNGQVERIGRIKFGTVDVFGNRGPTASIDHVIRTDNWPNQNFSSQIAFSTASETSGGLTQRAVITNQGLFGVGTATPGAGVHVVAPASTSPFIASISSTEAARIDSSGRLLVGTSTAADYGDGGTANAQFARAGSSQVHLARHENSGAGPFLVGAKSRGATTADNVIVQNGDTIFGIGANGGTGSSYKPCGSIQFQIDGTPTLSPLSMPGRIVLSTTADGASSPTERMRLDSSGRLGLGTASPANLLSLEYSSASSWTSGENLAGSTNDDIVGLRIYNANSSASAEAGILLTAGDSFTGQYTISCLKTGSNTGDLVFRRRNGTNGSLEAARLDSSGRLLVGTSSSPTGTTSQYARFTVLGNTNSSTGYGSFNIGLGSYTATPSGEIGRITFTNNGGADFARIQAFHDGAMSSDNDCPAALVFSTCPDGSASPTERMRINSAGAVSFGTTSSSPAVLNVQGIAADGANGYFASSRDGNPCASFNRKTNDGDIVDFRQDGVVEGTISVSGSTISYNGAHLSRWSQLSGGANREEILRGTVLSNIDEMCEWGEEDNEQLNRMKVSDVEGDRNVSGVFQAWDDDDDTYADDFYCAMTGDFIIRIAEGVTVQRGDLLMSAGDGTAKPQDDDIIRSKTIAKVTSTHITCTYDDGSYCVPCVLMAC